MKRYLGVLALALVFLSPYSALTRHPISTNDKTSPGFNPRKRAVSPNASGPFSFVAQGIKSQPRVRRALTGYACQLAQLS